MRWSVASSPCRPSEVRRCTRPCPAPASRTQPHLANENVEALIARPSTGGTRKPEESSSPRTSSRAERQRDHDHRGVLDLGQLGGGRGRHRRRGAGRSARPAWRGRRRPPRSAPGRSSGRPRPRSRPRCGPARAPSRRSAPAPAPPAPRSACAIPPGRPAKTGTSLAGQLGARAAARGRRGTPAAARSRAPRAAGPGRRTPRRAAARRAGRPPRRRAGWPTRSPTERSSSTGRPGCSASTRASPSSESTPDARELAPGPPARPSPSAAAAGARRGSRSATTATAGCTTSSPSSRASVDALGPAVEHRLRADVDDHAADLGPPQLAARLGRRLEHGHLVAVRRRGRGPRSARRARRPPPVPARVQPRRPRAAPAGCGSGRHEESQAGSDSRPNALRWKTSGSDVVRRARPRAAAAARSCGRRPRPRGRPCSRSGPAPRPA